MTSDRFQNVRFRAVFIAVFLFGFISHLESIDYWFVATDSIPLIESNRIFSLLDVIGTITSPLMDSTSFTEVALFWRPITELTYGFEYFVWGINPMGYHITNNVLHGFSAVLIAYIAWELTNRIRTTAISGILFAIHPISIEVVPAIARRADILLTIFLCATIISYFHLLKYNKNRLWIALPSIFFIFSLGSKETALVIPGLLVIIELFQIEQEFSDFSSCDAAQRLFPICSVAVGYLITRLVILGGLGGYQGASPSLISQLSIPLHVIHSLFLPKAIIPNQIPYVNLMIIFLYIGLGVSILAWLWVNRRFFSHSIWFSLTLCIFWIGFPTALYTISGEFSRRSVYICTGGLVIGLGLLVDLVSRRITISKGIISTFLPVSLLTILVITVVPMIILSPIIGSSPAWSTVSETNEDILTGLEDQTDYDMSSSRISITGVRKHTQVSRLTAYPLNTPYMKSYMIESWLRLKHSNGDTWNVTVKFDDGDVSSPASVTCEFDRDITCVCTYSLDM